MNKIFLAYLIAMFFTSAVSASSTQRILFLGDSLTEGYGVAESEAFPRVVEGILRSRGKNIEIINGGVSGSTSASGESRLKWHYKTKIDVMILALGANDGLRGLNLVETKKNLTKIIRIAKQHHSKILMLGVLMPPNYGKEYVLSFEKMYKEISIEERVPLMPFLLKDVAGKMELNLADGIHPNREGHKIIAKNVVQFLEKYL
jgi:acyl-CoA thioesterase-1